MEQGQYEDVQNGLVKRGGYGAVRPVKRKSDGKVLACKHIVFDESRYETQSDFKQRVEKEISLLKRLDHPNIVRYWDMQWVAGDHAVKIYTEWLQDENLDSYIAENLYRVPDWPSDRETWNLICQLSAALAYCHKGLIRDKSSLPRTPRIFNQKGWDLILHRDVKPENVLVQCKASGQVVFKLCDFGLSTIPSETGQPSFGGTKLYVAPEVTRQSPQWSDKADIFALGCTLFYFYKRDPPWRYELTMTSSVPMPVVPKHAAQDIKDLIYTCISTDRTKRLDAEELFMQSLKHLSEEDCALASVETSHTMSDIRPQGSGLQSPDSLYESAPVGPVPSSSSSAQAGQVDYDSRKTSVSSLPKLEAKVPSASRSIQPASIAPPRRGADSFFSLDNASVRPKSTPIPPSSVTPDKPKTVADGPEDLETVEKVSSPSTWSRIKSSLGGKNRGKAPHDTHRHVVDRGSTSSPSHLTVRPSPANLNMPSRPSTSSTSYSSRASHSVSMNFGQGNADEEIIHLIGSLVVDYQRYPPLDMYNLASQERTVMQTEIGHEMKFATTQSDTGSSTKRTMLESLSSANPTRAEVSVEVELDRAREILLENYEQYAQNLLRHDSAAREWMMRKRAQNKRVYLVVGYIVYTNARVQESGAKFGSVTGMSAVSVGSMGSQGSTSRMYTKRGDQTQAVYVREMKQYSPVGDVETAYFWGPRVHPLSA